MMGDGDGDGDGDCDGTVWCLEGEMIEYTR